MLMLLRSALLARFPDLVHGFSTARTPGAEDLGRGAPPERWAALTAALGVESAGVALASQVHGREVLEVEAPGLAGEGDALIVRAPGLLVAVRVADCVPILVVGARGVAAVHAGWRGIACDILGEAVARLGEPLGAAIGPCISPEQYEVGEEVIAGIAGSGVPREVFTRAGPRREHADLRAAAAWQLRRAGVPAIDVVQLCTQSNPDLHSHRRDGAQAGRQVGIIGRRC